MSIHLLNLRHPRKEDEDSTSSKALQSITWEEEVVRSYTHKKLHPLWILLFHTVKLVQESTCHLGGFISNSREIRIRRTAL